MKILDVKSVSSSPGRRGLTMKILKWRYLHEEKKTHTSYAIEEGNSNKKGGSLSLLLSIIVKSQNYGGKAEKPKLQAWIY